MNVMIVILCVVNSYNISEIVERRQSKQKFHQNIKTLQNYEKKERRGKKRAIDCLKKIFRHFIIKDNF